MFNNILVTTDLSDCGNIALAKACELGKKLGAPVTVLTIIEKEKHESPYFIDMKPLESKENLARAKQQAKDSMQGLLTDEVTFGADVTVDVVVDNNAVDGILEYVNKEKPGLLVMSGHGFGGFRAFILGGTVDKVLKLIKCPVLLVRGDENKC